MKPNDQPRPKVTVSDLPPIIFFFLIILGVMLAVPLIIWVWRWAL